MIDLARWLIGRIAAVARVPEAAVDLDAPMSAHGIDSVDAVTLAAELENQLGRRLSPTVIWEHESIAGLLAYLAHGGEAPVAPAAATTASLTQGQRALWFLQALAPDSTPYHIVGALRLRDVSPDKLARALAALAHRHPSLAACFPLVGGDPVQRPSAVPFSMPVEPARGLTDDELQARLVKDAYAPFDLTHGPIWRARLYAREAEHVLLLAFHHIAVDLWSLVVILTELGALYDGADLVDQAAPPLIGGTPMSLPAAPMIDRGAAEHALLASPRGEALERYWREQVTGALGGLDLPTDHPRPPTQTFRGASLPIALTPALSAAIRALARESHTTPYVVLLSAFQIWLARHTGQEDFLIGSPVAGRGRAQDDRSVGYFVNPVPMRARLGGDPAVRALLQATRQTVRGALAHQELPFPLLVERLQIPRDPSRSPLFQTMFVLERPHLPGLHSLVAGDPAHEVALGGLHATAWPLPQQGARLDLTITLVDQEPAFTGWFEYATDLFDETTIRRMAARYETLLTSLCATPDAPISSLRLLPDDEAELVVRAWNATDRPDSPIQRTAHGLFEDQVDLDPDRIAVVHEHTRMTYGELDRAANRLAHALRARGVTRGAIVGLYLPRTPDLLVGILGILKAGAAYLPLDPTYPKERLDFILADAAARVIVTPELLDATRGADPARLPSQAGPDDLCYVIYTSGSTGRPKGVAIRHGSVANLAWYWARTVFTPAELARVCFWTTVCFDGSAFEIFVPLCFGGGMVLVENLLLLPQAPAAHEVTLINSVPSALAELARMDGVPRSLRAVTMGGEPLPIALAMQLYELPLVTKVYNVYGPTEDTVHSTTWLAARGESSKIGRPIANKQAYVLDTRRQPVPIGVAGELYLGGRGLAVGYLGRAELTAERFVPGPFAAGEKIYRTGDLARWLPDGNLEFLGRIDHQVKIRGFRIELGEIEAVLGSHPGVSEVCVLAREDVPGEKRLVGYVVATADPATLRAHLARSLPPYMVPQEILVLPAMPQTPNGKIDRRALPAPAQKDHRAETYRAPRDERELALTRLWEQVLSVPAVGIADDFFELGGHSLLAVRLLAELKSRLGINLPLSALFEGATVERLARRLGKPSTPTRAVTIQEGEPGATPFYCVHPAGGNVLSYVDLARRLPHAQPFIGLPAPGLEGDRPAIPSVPELAAYHVATILAARPAGRIFLGGWSFGGLVAYEMARLLRARDRDVASLILFDSAAPGYLVHEYADEALLLAAFARDLGGVGNAELGVTAEDLRRLSEDEQLDAIVTRARHAHLLPHDGSVTRLVNVFRAAARAGRTYQPAPYEGELTIIRSLGEDPSMPVPADPTVGWGALAARVVVHTTPGDHYSMFRRPHVDRLAELVVAALP